MEVFLSALQSHHINGRDNPHKYETNYQPSIQVKTGTNKEMIFPLQKTNIKELDNMTISSSKIKYKKAEQTTSVIKLTRDEINNSPGALEDINEVLKILPSARSGS